MEKVRRIIYSNLNLWEDYEEYAKEILLDREEEVTEDSIWEEIYKAAKDCDYVYIYDENGHFYLRCYHHDGSKYYEIKKVTEKGIKYLENWEHNWNDKRTEENIHDRIMERYSTLPHFAHNVYGCPRVEYKKVSA